MPVSLTKYPCARPRSDRRSRYPTSGSPNSQFSSRRSITLCCQLPSTRGSLLVRLSSKLIASDPRVRKTPRASAIRATLAARRRSAAGLARFSLVLEPAWSMSSCAGGSVRGCAYVDVSVAAGARGGAGEDARGADEAVDRSAASGRSPGDVRREHQERMDRATREAHVIDLEGRVAAAPQCGSSSRRHSTRRRRPALRLELDPDTLPDEVALVAARLTDRISPRRLHLDGHGRGHHVHAESPRAASARWWAPGASRRTATASRSHGGRRKLFHRDELDAALGHGGRPADLTLVSDRASAQGAPTAKRGS
jgi:hypothetical protein